MFEKKEATCGNAWVCQIFISKGHFIATAVPRVSRIRIRALLNFKFSIGTAVREALEAAGERHHHPGASDGGDGGGSVGERTGQRRGPQGDLHAPPRLNGL